MNHLHIDIVQYVNDHLRRYQVKLHTCAGMNSSDNRPDASVNGCPITLDFS